MIATSRKLFWIAVLAFVSLGLPDGTLGVAWPSIKATFDLPISGLGVLLVAGTVGYLISGTQSGHLLGRWGVGQLLFWSTLLTAFSSMGFAVVPWWPALVALAGVAGLGAGAIDAGTNAYAAAKFSPAKITWLHASYGLGAASGPLLMSWVVERALPWQLGYLCVSLALAALAGIFWHARTWWAPGAASSHSAAIVAPAVEMAAPEIQTSIGARRIRDALRRPAVWLNIVVFFLYTGLESAAGQWAFSLLTLSRSWDAQQAGLATSVYWGSLSVGRVAFGFAAQRFSPTLILRVGLGMAPLAAGLLALAENELPTFAGLGWLGFSLAPVFPCLIAETPGKVGADLSDHAVALQVSAAYLGIATVPSLIGVLARTQGLEIIGPFLAGGQLLLLLLHEISLLVAKKSSSR